MREPVLKVRDATALRPELQARPKAAIRASQRSNAGRPAWPHDAMGLNAPHKAIDSAAHKAARICIEAEGPFCAIEPLEYVISVGDLHCSRAAPPPEPPRGCRWAARDDRGR